MNSISQPDPILKRQRVQELTSLPVSTLYFYISKGKFPAPVRLGERSVGWRLSDVQGWLDSRQPARGGVAL
ncbi:MAG: AlpA family phage regulatory protein [Magnetococcales bacterium]|nr:AlpA family phage regulatory protein [Magnetococcales bacterium]